MNRRGRYEALRRRSIGTGIAVSLVAHALAFAFVRLRVDTQPVRLDEPVRLLRVEAPPPVEPERLPELIRIRDPETLTAAAPASTLPDLAALPEPAPQLAGAPSTLLADLPVFPVPAGLVPEGTGTADAPLDVPLYEPGAVGRVKRDWLTSAGLNPRGAAVAVWVVGCPAPRTIVSADPKPTYRGRPCH